MTEYRIENFFEPAIVRIHGDRPTPETLEAPSIKILKVQERNRKNEQKKKSNAQPQRQF